MNDIPERQNSPHLLQYLAAQRQLYSENKRWTGVWFIGSVVIAILGAGAVAFTPTVNALIVFAWLLVVLIELLALPLITKKRSQAASIQELFDTELLQLPWNDVLTSKPDFKVIELAVKRFNKRNNPQEEWESLRNWYETPNLGSYPIHQARILCQMENVKWDARQRRAWARWLMSAVIGFIILLILMGIGLHWELQQLFTGMVLLLIPLLVAAFSHAITHQRAAARLDYLEGFMSKLWEDAQKPDVDVAEITQRSRELQDEIFHHREDNIPVFDWVYNRLKDKSSPPKLV